MENMTPTKALLNFIDDTGIQDLPEELLEGCKRCFLDWLGVTLGGMNHPPVPILIDLLHEVGGKRQASIIGYGMKTDILNAALVNGTMAHALDYDDAHMHTRNHPSAPLIAALLSVAEYEKLSGSDFVAAYVVGFEVSTRVGLALGKTYYDMGWHATPILGRFGAAAGVGKLLRLNAKRLNHAFGLAATQAGGIRKSFGTMAKPFHAGKAAMDGVLSAVLARRGFKAPEDILDENSGFLGMFSPPFNTSHITHNLGKHYHLPDVSIKPYAACLVIHPAIDGLICIRNEHRLEAGAIDRIDLEVSPICLALGDHAAPKDSLEAKFSIYYCAAVAVLAGDAKESHFTDELVNDARIRNVMQKVEVNGNASLTESEAMVKVRSKDGTEYVTQVSGPKGDPGNPLDFDEVAEKFRDLSKHLLSEDEIQQIITMVQDLEGLDNLTGLLTLCCKGSP